MIQRDLEINARTQFLWAARNIYVVPDAVLHRGRSGGSCRTAGQAAARFQKAGPAAKGETVDVSCVAPYRAPP